MVAQKKFKYGLLALFVAATLTGCGLDGDDGAQGVQGPTGPQGADGDDGDDGAPGQDGADGNDGAPGQDGSNGQDASLGVSMAVVGRALLGQGGAEIVQYHAETQTIYATNGSNNTVAYINASGLTGAALDNPLIANTLNENLIVLPTQADGNALGGVTSIAISNNLLAVAVSAADRTDNGYVLFYNGLETGNPTFLDSVEVGALPDMVTFTPNGGKVLVALEGEPSDDYTVDPVGGIAVIDILASDEPEETAEIVGFDAFNDQKDALMAMGMHFPNPAGRTINGVEITTSVAQDLEPEYITTTNELAYVTLQENNGVAILDLETLDIDIVGLGFKDWSGKSIDVQEDGSVSFGQYEGLYGVYMPDTIAHYEWKDATFLITANEGDAREYIFSADDEAACTAAGGLDFDDGDCLAYTDEVQVEDLVAEPGSELEMLQINGEANDLRVTQALGDADGDGEYDAAYTYGARSFTVWDQNGLVVYDSGDDFERITASIYGAQFNNGDDENEGDSRSENKGPEPEAVTVGTINARTYAFIGLERMGGIMVYDITNPYDITFSEYINNRDLTEGLVVGDAIGDLAPESLVLVNAEDSPTGGAILLVGSEVSGSVTVFSVTPN